MFFDKTCHMAGEPNIWAVARRQTLLKSSRYRLNIKAAENKENFKKHPFRVRLYYSVKRPTVRFLYTPARNLALGSILSTVGG